MGKKIEFIWREEREINLILTTRLFHLLDLQEDGYPSISPEAHHENPI